MPQDDAGWLEGRTRSVRVYLTEEEHAIVRQAAALADRSVSRFSIEAIVEVARRHLGDGQAEAAPPPAKQRGKGK
jgi:uncharacterized protein (DUF1778 family)